MPFAYTDEQEAFAEAITDTLSHRCPMSLVRASIAEPERWREVWRELVALDLPGLLVPEGLGGVGLAPVDLACVLEAAGRFAAPVPLTATLGAFTPLLLAGAEGAQGTDESAASAIIARVLGGAAATVAPVIGGGRARLSGGALTAAFDGIPDASRAELIAIPAIDEGGADVLVVGDLVSCGVEVLDAMDSTSPVGRLRLDDHPIGDAIVLRGDFTPAWAVAWLASAAELVGLAAQLISLTVAYARDRTQFGVPIGTFQGVKHQIVDAHLTVERARSVTMYAAGLCSQPGSLDTAAAQRAAHQAKALASEAGSRAARVGVQVHGGVGITQEHDVSLMYLRARQLATLMGGADEHWHAAGAIAARQGAAAGAVPAG